MPDVRTMTADELWKLANSRSTTLPAVGEIIDELARRAALWERLDTYAENWLFTLATDANANVWHCRAAGSDMPDTPTARAAVEAALGEAK